MSAQTGGAPEKKGAVVLATVQGDIHDIGKNIVKVLLENYGFDVDGPGQGRRAGDGAGGGAARKASAWWAFPR